MLTNLSNRDLQLPTLVKTKTYCTGFPLVPREPLRILVQTLLVDY